MDEQLAVVEDEEEKMLEERRRLTGSMMGPNMVTLTWVVGEV